MSWNLDIKRQKFDIEPPHRSRESAGYDDPCELDDSGALAISKMGDPPSRVTWLAEVVSQTLDMAALYRLKGSLLFLLNGISRA